MVKFIFISAIIWTIALFIYIFPLIDKQNRIKSRSAELSEEIHKLERKLDYLKRESEDLNKNNRFYIERLAREQLKLKPI